ncbi:BtaManbiosPhlase [Alicyclobacillus shizuokensis]|uniref:BtaManbiosPhlase n=1 Tax=Alicyclobacillus shizuokensis TaxID=392014 RepID=UPI0008328941|nr:glycoside hydrolase family 130 protein [Alicyclobacillus shizuokensis]MCL6625003.1 glycoside hydrolase family 130 protein [Alicyclobacillus shizuokensis]
MGVYRYPENPILTPADVPPHRDDFEVIGVFNAGVAKYHDEIILLLRVAERPVAEDERIVKAAIFDVSAKGLRIETFHRNDQRYDFSDPRSIAPVERRKGDFTYLTSISHLRIARSVDGRHFRVDERPFLYPQTELETFGVEDARVTQIGDTYYITYSAVSARGVGVVLASTKNFHDVQRHGMILPPENKDVVLFPEPIGGKYYCLHRPVPSGNGSPDIWLAESSDLNHWGNHHHLMGCRPEAWDSRRLGAGAPPLRTEHGWLELYHAADEDARYCVGAVLLDLEDPSQVLVRSRHPILVPEADYETNGFFGNVVFPCGALLQGDTVQVYYGVADTSMACVEIPLQTILDSLGS